ncbi:MAG: AraC family transcriptional regulator [Ruminococcaceae bacterium]|nr:AraC family transcriptional regulator [Oscillospiraceae bacterium]
MDNIQFCNSFYFATFNFKNRHHTDNSVGTLCHHIGYIKSGSAAFDVEGTVYTFTAGDVFYTPPGCRYHSYWEGENICYDSYAFYNFVQHHNTSYGVQKLVMSSHAWELLAALSENKQINCRTVGLLFEMLYEVLPHMTPTVRDQSREMLSRARAYMRANIDCTVPTIARHLGISESALYTLFREKGNTTPITEKNRIRTEMAVELLQTTDLSVEEISSRLSFSSAAYFRKVLFAFFGKTPREMRKNKSI